MPGSTRKAKRAPSRGKRRPKAGKKTDGSGPLEWLLPMMESSYTPLGEVGNPVPAAATAVASAFCATSPAMIAAAPATVWCDRLHEYRQRKAATAAPPAAAVAAQPAAAVAAVARKWLPLGPSVVMDGQTVGNQPVAGRVSRLAVTPGGGVLYAASANGGVFRSDDGGTSWRAMMDGFDLDPTSFASASLVCGAIALDPADPDRLWVGTGDGDTHQYFRDRVIRALPAYRGVGIVRSDDGGATWSREQSVPDLAGEAFFAFAVDPANPAALVGATTAGLYRRVPAGGGRFQWQRVLPGVFASVVAATSDGNTRFIASEWGKDIAPSRVVHSDDGGATWTATGTAFPAANVGRVDLAVAPSDPKLVYAFAADRAGKLQGLFRLDGVNGRWKAVSNLPPVLPGGQGSYDLAIAVDPGDANLVFLGGDRTAEPPHGGSIWRCAIKPSGGSFRVSSAASIGTHAHADIHMLCHTPGDPTELWCACDGGVFLNRDPRGSGEFVGQNNGLACLCSNFMAQHPTDPGIVFTGLQDNGTARSSSGPIWTRVGDDDGGYCIVNWSNPKQVLIYSNGKVFRSTTGGTSLAGWTKVGTFEEGQAMTKPMVGVPLAPSTPAAAKIVALGAGPRVFLSEDFALSWPRTLQLSPVAGEVFALAFASANRLFVGTTVGQVFRADRAGGAWTLARLDNAAAGPLGLAGLITDVAVDWADAAGQSIYVAFGGMGNRRRVWHFDGTRWQARSGAGASGLLDVEHNALAVDRTAPQNVYVGADIGVWHSSDGGRNWQPLAHGLPDAPVFDLQIHPTQRLLRAATHGRGLFELALP